MRLLSLKISTSGLWQAKLELDNLEIEVQVNWLIQSFLSEAANMKFTPGVWASIRLPTGLRPELVATITSRCSVGMHN